MLERTANALGGSASPLLDWSGCISGAWGVEMFHRNWGVGILGALTLIAVAGCAPSAATSVPRASDALAAHTSSATPTTTAEALTIVLDAGALVVQNTSGAAVHSYPYAAGATDAIAELTSLLGDPVSTTYVPPGKCWSDMTTVRWHTLQLMYYGQDPASTRLLLLNATNTPPTAVEITTPHGARVGDPWKPYFADVSDHLTKSADYQGQYFDSVVDATGADGPRSGTIVSAVDGVISTVAAPSSLDADC